jgi:hypothetical protein
LSSNLEVRERSVNALKKIEEIMEKNNRRNSKAKEEH